MEMILATTIVVAVIFLGAFITMGNERQKVAIEALREQIVNWAIQDLRLKRERFRHNVKIDDPVTWINKNVSDILGYDLNLKTIALFEEPQSLVCEDDNGNKVVFTPFSPKEIRRQKRNMRSSRLSRFAHQNPLLNFKGKLKAYEFSVLNSGVLFDLEFDSVWKCLAGKDLVSSGRIWMYLISK